MRNLVRTTVVAMIAATTMMGCNRNKDATVDTSSSAGAILPSNETAGVRIGDIDMGRTINANKEIGDKTDDFKPTDTIYASVPTTATAADAKITARWTFQDGQVVDERTETVATTGDARTEFHISKPDGLPEGKYTLHVLVNGSEVKTKDVTVKK
jgi:hypothetical protein